MIDYYRMLDVEQNAEQEEIEAALKEKKRLWTQRQNAPKLEQQQQAANNLRLIPEIESVLFDAQKRKEYDSKLHSAPKDESHVDASKIEADELVKEGWRLFYNNKIADALMVATRATEIQGNNPDAWALLGSSRAKWGDVGDAIYEYKRAIKLRPNDATFYYELGGIYEDEKQWQDAVDQYSKAVHIDPDKTVYRASMGSVYVKVEMYEKAIDLLEQCVQEEPDREGYKYLLGVAYHDSVVASWSESPYLHSQQGSYIATEEQAKNSLIRLQKAQALNVDDISSGVDKLLKLTHWALDRHWDWNWDRIGGGFVTAVIIPIIVLIVSWGLVSLGALWSITTGIGLLAFYIWIKFVPGWKINSRILHFEERLEEVR